MKFLDKVKGVFQSSQPATASDDKNQTRWQKIWKWVYKLRSVILAVPVLVTAIIMAIVNAARLPAQVQIYFPTMANKEWVVKLVQMDKGVAIFIPLLITVFCLLMMFCSRKVVYPWIISIFSLVLPLFMAFISVFPG